jgi:hypothetical protein
MRRSPLGAISASSGLKRPFASKSSSGFVALHPLLEEFDVFGLLVHFAHRHLVRAPGILGAFAVNFLGARPALGRAQNNHRPARALDAAVLARGALDALDFTDGLVERGAMSWCIFAGSLPSTKIGV